MKKSGYTEEHCVALKQRTAPRRSALGGDEGAGRRGHPADGRIGTGLLPLDDCGWRGGVGELRRVKQLEEEEPQLSSWSRNSVSTSTFCRRLTCAGDSNLRDDKRD